jgi:malate synthase
MAASADSILSEVNILGDLNDKTKQILSKDAAVFLALLHRTFNQRRKDLLQRRVIRLPTRDQANPRE